MTNAPIPEEAFVDAEPGDWFDPAWVPEGWIMHRGPNGTATARRTTDDDADFTVWVVWRKVDELAYVYACHGQANANVGVSRDGVAKAVPILVATVRLLAVHSEGCR